MYAYALCALLMLAGCGDEAPVGDPIAVRDAWIREPPPRSPAAGYLVIENRGDAAVELVGAETAAAARTEIHVMEHKDGRMTMDRVESLLVPAGATLELKSGGTHLMLLQLNQPLKSGDEVELLLRFSDGTLQKIQAPVRKGGDYAGR